MTAKAFVPRLLKGLLDVSFRNSPQVRERQAFDKP
jgi:hypothetical protein